MGRTPGQPEKKSQRKAETSRANARAPRPAARRAASAGEEETLKRAVSSVRALTPAAVAVLRRGMKSRDLSIAVRSAGEVLDRAGVPRQTQSAVAVSVQEPPKIIDLRDDEDDPAPSGWNDRPTVAATEDRPVIPETNGLAHERAAVPATTSTPVRRTCSTCGTRNEGAGPCSICGTLEMDDDDADR